jgi:glucose/arabinose dehydrogenase
MWPEPVLSPLIVGLESPVEIARAGDGSGRLFVVEQRGRIRLFRDGAVLDRPFLDITDRVACCGERGLLSVAFPPNYSSKGQFYVNYTDRSGATVVARYSIGDDSDVADRNSEEILLTIPQPYANHNGGQLAFGPVDGYLYVGTGDGGSGGDPQNNAQNPDSLLGKILRIDVESGVRPYTVPASNPYVQIPGYRPEIWALGLRNPWRFSFDQRTGDLYIGDVGQGQWEEVDFQASASAGGENYGWRIMEGSHCYNPQDCEPTGLVLPVAEYDHSSGWCSVTGGVVYRGQEYPRMEGVYFFADFCTGTIWGLKRDGSVWQSAILAEAGFPVSSFGQDDEGNIYVVHYYGEIYILSDTQTAEPTSTLTNTPEAVPTASVTPASTETAVPTPTSGITPTSTLIGLQRLFLPIILKQWPG